MLSFLGGESFAGAWGIFLAYMEKGEIRGFGKRNVGAGRGGNGGDEGGRSSSSGLE
ncbi:hypothetical protein [Bartonella sp. AP58NXGY]|uniref:hypothetical protein n=1 Tax=Bartonella sp. AP58NXGY TaxID=3243498 RepID=UPI0035D0E698